MTTDNTFKISDIIKLLDAETNTSSNGLSFTNISIDTRTLAPHDLFIAISGETFDGHKFLEAAKNSGAVAAIVDRFSPEIPLLQIKVQDTILALGKLAKWKRQKYSTPILAITGSVGKTSSKTMLAAILSNIGETLVSKKSFNNAIGVPLTLWQLNQNHKFVVMEVGANSHGEISYLMNLLKPLTVAGITNVVPCHLEGFGSMAGIAKAKAEIFTGFSENINDGIAILNSDDEYYNYWNDIIGNRKQITFGLTKKADITATEISVDKNGYPSFTLILPNGKIPIKLPLLGSHNVMNALIAASAAFAISAPIDAIKAGLEIVQPVYMRLIAQTGINNCKIIDDTYNANPSSVAAALNILASETNEKIFVFGGMKELGNEEKKWHKFVGQYAKKVGINHLFLLGTLCEPTAAEFGKNAFLFKTQEDLIKKLLEIADNKKTILIKGSRSTQMENVVKALVKK